MLHHDNKIQLNRSIIAKESRVSGNIATTFNYRIRDVWSLVKCLAEWSFGAFENHRAVLLHLLCCADVSVRDA